MIAPQSSSLMAGRKGSIAAASKGWSFVLLVVLLLARTSLADPTKIYDIDLRTHSVADALNGLSEQTGVPVVFPYDLVKDRKANPVVGRYTVLGALDELLKDTGLSGGLSDKGVVTVSLAKSDTPTSGETSVPHEENQQATKKTRADKRPAIAAFFASIAAAFSASAEEAADVGADQTKMSSVVVTAEKRIQREQDVPVAMTVLDPSTLAENGQSRLTDYFASVPGLNVTSPAFLPGSMYITIRGLSSGLNQNSTVAAVVDDVPTGSGNELVFGNLTVPDIDPSDLANIEVLKGPQGTLYGANSLGGLIKYVTVDPSTEVYKARVEVTGVDVPDGGTGYTVRGAVNIPVSDQLALRISGFDRRDPGYTDDVLTGQNNINSANVYGGHLAAMWHLSEDVSLKLGALLQQTDGHGLSYFNATLGKDGILQPTLDYLNYTAERVANPYTRQQQLYSATLKAKIAGADLVAVSGYVVNKLRGINDYGTTFNSFFSNLPVAQSAEAQDYETKKFSQELRLSDSVGHWLDWLLGGFYTHEDSPNAFQNLFSLDPNTLGLGTDLVKFVNKLTLSEYAVFGDVTIHLTDHFDLQLGGRESWDRQNFQNDGFGPGASVFFPAAELQSPNTAIGPQLTANQNAFTYNATPQFKIAHDLMVYARVASGYRIGSPNVNAGQPGIPISYKPDRTTNYELGLKGDFLQHSLSIDAAVYHISWHDFQIPIQTPQGLYFESNAGAAKSDGVEISLQAQPTSTFTISAQGSYNQAELTQDLPSTVVAAGAYALSGARLPYSIPWSGGVTLNQDIPLSGRWRGFLEGEATYVGLRDGEFAARSTALRPQFPAYTTVNLRTGAKSDSWYASLYVNNLANKRGIAGAVNTFERGHFEGDYFGAVIQPRTVGLSVVRNW
jgi:iron complex outermembrane recepter protein